jgi:hypothetical protein
MELIGSCPCKTCSGTGYQGIFIWPFNEQIPEPFVKYFNAPTGMSVTDSKRWIFMKNDPNVQFNKKVFLSALHAVECDDCSGDGMELKLFAGTPYQENEHSTMLSKRDVP